MKSGCGGVLMEVVGYKACLVGVPGLEPGTSWSQTMRASRLRYTPKPQKV